MKSILFLTLSFLVVFISATSDIVINTDQNIADAQCNITHYDLSTLDPPFFDVDNSGFKTLDALTLTVRASRRYYLAQVNESSEDFNHDAACVNLWQLIPNPNDVTDCTVWLQAVIPWSEVRPFCGVYLDTTQSDSTHSIFRGSVLLNLWESNIPNARSTQLTRLIHSVFPFSLSFPLTVSTSQTLTVYAPVALDSAIIRQFTVRLPSASSPTTADIRLYTSIQYPFKLISPSLGVTSRNDFSISPIVETVNYLLPGEQCLATGGICEQEWIIDFNATSPPVCDFTGDYTLNFITVCEPSLGSSCPLPLDVGTNTYQSPASITFHITTEDFCPKAFADIDVHASLTSFQDDLLTISKDSFLQGDTAYFKTTVSSSSATIVGTTIQSISSPTASSTLLYQLPTGSLVPQVTVSNYPATGLTSVTTSKFSVGLTNDLFNVPVDSSSPFTFNTVSNVVFANTQGQTHTMSLEIPFTNSHPYMITTQDTPVSSRSRPVDASKSVTLGSPSVAASSSATNSIIYIAVGVAVGLALIATLVFITMRRRKAAAAVKSEQNKKPLEMTGASSAVSGSASV